MGLRRLGTPDSSDIPAEGKQLSKAQAGVCRHKDKLSVFVIGAAHTGAGPSRESRYATH
jgi:hypothetical protein